MLNPAARQVILNASAHSIPLPDAMFHTCVTSPPYYSLRKYAGQQVVDWPPVDYAPMPGLAPIHIAGCDPNCDHEWGEYQIPPKHSDDGITGSTLEGGKTTQTKAQREPIGGAYCQKCGGWRGALGLEPTPEAYIGHLVLCFREVRRVMREDGVAWIVMGDSYQSQPAGNSDATMTAKQRSNPGSLARWKDCAVNSGLQQGDLMLVPHRLTLALQGDGWVVRNDVVWAKKSPMPESVSGWRWERCRVKLAPSEQKHIPGGGRTNYNVPGAHASAGTPNTSATWTPCPGCARCEATGGYVLRRGSWRHTRAHETVIMAVKGMGYFSDQERVREKQQGDGRKRGCVVSEWRGAVPGHPAHNGVQDTGFRNPRSVLSADELDELFAAFLSWYYSQDHTNPPDVMSPSPESYGRDHYAVFPRTLITPLLLATAPPRVCPACGAPWAPVVEREKPTDTQLSILAHNRNKQNPGSKHIAGREHEPQQPIHSNMLRGDEWMKLNVRTTHGHRPTCNCWAAPGQPEVEVPTSPDGLEGTWAPAPIPGTVLDPFVGSGTTLAVCRELGVNCVGLDISASYLDDHAKPRIGLTPSTALDTLPLFRNDNDV